VRSNGSKLWRFAYRFDGKLRELLHLARHAWHQIREDFEWLVDDEHD
jgi:hypothetical protein